MPTNRNAYSQKVHVTEVPLYVFHNMRSDIYKHALIGTDRTVIQMCLS